MDRKPSTVYQRVAKPTQRKLKDRKLDAEYQGTALQLHQRSSRNFSRTKNKENADDRDESPRTKEHVPTQGQIAMKERQQRQKENRMQKLSACGDRAAVEKLSMRRRSIDESKTTNSAKKITVGSQAGIDRQNLVDLFQSMSGFLKETRHDLGNL